MDLGQDLSSLLVSRTVRHYTTLQAHWHSRCLLSDAKLLLLGGFWGVGPLCLGSPVSLHRLGQACRQVTRVLVVPHRVVTVEEAMAVRVDTVVADTAMVVATVVEATECHCLAPQHPTSSQVSPGRQPVFVGSPE